MLVLPFLLLDILFAFFKEIRRNINKIKYIKLVQEERRVVGERDSWSVSDEVIPEPPFDLCFKSSKAGS